jgi:hypothetical protein
MGVELGARGFMVGQFTIIKKVDRGKRAVRQFKNDQQLLKVGEM